MSNGQEMRVQSTEMITYNYNTMKNFLELKNIIDADENNAAKFYEKGNALTGTRLRNPCNS